MGISMEEVHTTITMKNLTRTCKRIKETRNYGFKAYLSLRIILAMSLLTRFAT